MEENSQRRRQNDPPVPPSAGQRYSLQDPTQRGSFAGSSTDRFRPPAPPAPLHSSPSTARGMGGTASYSGYYQEPAAASFSTTLPQNTMAYQSDYNQDSRQTQPFSTYNPTLMYNV